MKRVLLVFHFSFFIFHFSFSQTPGEWTWMSGDSATNAAAVYGVKGIASAGNHPPALYEYGSWTDKQGNFWIYGGLSLSVAQRSADLWKYDVATNMWTWVNGPGTPSPSAVYGVKGVAAIGNNPGGRSHGNFNWVDTAGNLWFCGGFNSNWNNDLWKYDISSNMWTWVSGDNTANPPGIYGVQGIPSVNNKPPGKAENASAWIDGSNNLWMFAGQAYAGGCYNDLWKYNIATNEWTWMKGSNTTAAPPVYGVKGVSAPSNDPGARMAYSHWKDKSGNFWLFGGGFTYNSGLNDTWKYDLGTNQWTWMNGSNAIGNAGNYSIQCIESPNYLPSNRYENRACWTDSCGRFWMMGGMRTQSDMVNDLWRFDPTALTWTLISGTNAVNPYGVFGTKGISSPLNIPRNRTGANGWMDSKGNLWIFGGIFYITGQLTSGDLWRYVPDPTCGGCAQALPHSVFSSSDTVFCSEPTKCISFHDSSSGNPISWQWLFPGATPNFSNQQNPTNICYYNAGTYPVTLIVTNAAGNDTLTVSPMITVGGTPAPPVITVVGGDTLYCSHAVHYQWYLNGSPIASATDSFYIAKQGGVYSVQITDGNGCYSLSMATNVGVEDIAGDGLQIMIYPNPVKDQFAVFGFQFAVGRTIIELYNVLGEKVYSELTDFENRESKTVNCKQFPSGVYILKINLPSVTLNRKIIINR